jgi:hypothetical protein
LHQECLLSEVSRKSDLRTDLPVCLRVRRSLILWAFLLLLYGLAGNSTASAGEIQDGASASPGPGLPFAIADFDGDRRPDVANVQAGDNASGASSYWIQLQLSGAGRQSIQLDAPSGGLLIEARDVNGDHAIDLVLTTAWSRQPVAVLLNDGHGKFSRAEPTSFPGAFRSSSTNWLPATILTADVVGVPPESGTGIGAEGAELPHGGSLTGLVPPSCAGFPANPFLISSAGRAPPSEVPYL